MLLEKGVSKQISMGIPVIVFIFGNWNILDINAQLNRVHAFLHRIYHEIQLKDKINYT